MFELGRSLRETRVRQGAELEQVAADTRIRMRYLAALEEERFDLLPGSVYAKGFLRTYAEYLGLDGQVFVDEYNARFEAEEEEQPAPPQLDLQHRSLWPYGLAAGVLILALGGALLSRQLSGSSPEPARPAGASARAAGPPVTPPTAQPPGAVATPARPVLVLRAAGGPCWVSVRRSSEQGRLLFESTLEPGQSRRFRDRQLWVRIGAPWNLIVNRGGRRLSIPQTVATVLVTSRGVRTVG